MERRYFLKDFFFWILAFFFGYTIQKNNGDIILQQIDPTTIKNKEEKSVIAKINVLSKGKLFVTDFGAKGDGVADDTRAIDNLINTALAYNTRNTSLNSNYMSDIEIVFPPGTFVYRGKDLFSTATNRTTGFKISGAGRYATRISYRPFTTGNYMFHNNDKLLGLTFEDMSFYGDINNNFMLSHSSGGAQNYVFSRVTWSNWNKVMELTGDNTNSEMTWYSCNFNGTIKKGLYSGTTNTSDQFLNYNFFGCNYEVQEGDFIDMSKGGNINIWGGSFIHLNTKAGTFFKLNGNSHARGVQRFICTGVRFEHRAPASKLIDCSWGFGNVNFLSCDTSANEDGTMDKSTRAIFKSGNTGIPIIKFDGCTLGGIHEYWYASNAWLYPSIVTYDSCSLLAVKDVKSYDDFIQYINENAGINSGSKPAIKFVNCRNGKYNQLADSEFRFEVTNRGWTTKKILSVKDTRGSIVKRANAITEGIEEVWLPIGAIITKITLYSPPGAVTSSRRATFTVETFETTPTVLATASQKPYSAGFNFNQDLFHICDTDQKRHLKIRAGTGVDQYNDKALFLIEYIE